MKHNDRIKIMNNKISILRYARGIFLGKKYTELWNAANFLQKVPHMAFRLHEISSYFSVLSDFDDSHVRECKPCTIQFYVIWFCAIHKKWNRASINILKYKIYRRRIYCLSR